MLADPEDMSGSRRGLGFLHLYELLQGKTRVHVITAAADEDTGRVGGGRGWSGAWEGYDPMDYGGYAAFSGKGSSSNDSYRYALLLSRLYSDSQVMWGAYGCRCVHQTCESHV